MPVLSQELSAISTSLSKYASTHQANWKGDSGSHMYSLYTDGLQVHLKELTAKIAKLENAISSAGTLEGHITNKNNYIKSRNDYEESSESYKNYSKLIGQEETAINELKPKIINSLKESGD